MNYALDNNTELPSNTQDTQLNVDLGQTANNFLVEIFGTYLN